MNKARMTFRFSEEASNKAQSQPRPHPQTEEIRTSTNLKANIAKTEEIAVGAMDIKNAEKAHSNIIPIPLKRKDPLLDDSFSLITEEHKANKQNTYYENSVYDDGYHELNIPYSPLFSEATSKQYTVHHRRSPGGWKVFGSITAAIVTGVLFGFAAMSMLNPGADSELKSIKTETAGADLTSPNESVNTQGSDTGNIGSSAVSIPGASYFMLQYGVFSTAEGAAKAKNELTEAGIAAGSDPLDEARVYAGVSSLREEAKLVSNQLKTEGVELYVREITLPAVSDVVFTANTDAISPFFETSRALTDMLASLSINQLGQQAQSAVSEDKLTELADVHHRFTSSTGAFQAGLSEIGKKIELKMESSMSTAISAVSEYNKNPSKEHMWKVQSAVMDFILQEKQLLEIMRQT